MKDKIVGIKVEGIRNVIVHNLSSYLYIEDTGI